MLWFASFRQDEDGGKTKKRKRFGGKSAGFDSAPSRLKQCTGTLPCLPCEPLPFFYNVYYPYLDIHHEYLEVSSVFGDSQLLLPNLHFAEGMENVLNLKGSDYFEAEKQYRTNLKGLLQEGYQKYKHGFCQLFTPTGFIVILSADYVHEIAQLPAGTLDFHGATQKRMIGDYNWLQVGDKLPAHTILSDLTRHLVDVLPAIQEEIEYCLRHELPDCKDQWTPGNIQKIAPRLIAIIMGRVFVGPDLNRQPEWVNNVTQFVDDVFAAGWKIKAYSHFTRRFAARYLVAEVHRVRRQKALARHELVPLLEDRLGSVADPDVEEHLDLLQWLVINNSKLPQPRTLANLAELALVAYVGSTHTAATTLTNVLLDLAARPSDIAALHHEINENNSLSGDLSSKESFYIKNTSRLDSFMKESQRLSPAFLMTFSRIVRKPFTLSCGLTFPAGTHIIVPASTISLDAEVWESADTFDGARFANLRSIKPENALRYQFVGTSPQAMHFGYGRNACPGRFFASMVIKAFVVKLLKRYDIKLSHERLHNTAIGSQNSAPTNAEILFKLWDGD
ncbi:cytochrome P450 monooxygenase [Fusarium circinatum]|uniref:Cytochrome P450 monooxygenase n=1 Tax=Fusarium circinatum TaxID=48490 RepID=A0A8H5XBV3_FUSCI|nr:cytochrome P450 monooxygenase [Fusarium circinatum]